MFTHLKNFRYLGGRKMQESKGLFKGISVKRVYDEKIIKTKKGKKRKYLKEDLLERLHEISSEELFKARLKDESGLVVHYPLEKKDVIDITVSEHLCTFCARCSAALDPKGCSKVRARTVEGLRQEGYSIKDSIFYSDRIEAFSFIKKGVETFNTKREFLVIVECENYYILRKDMSERERYNMLTRNI